MTPPPLGNSDGLTRLLGTLFALAVTALGTIAVLGRVDAADTTGPAEQETAPAIDAESSSAQAESTLRRFTVVATGDILVHESVANEALTAAPDQPPAWDFAPMFGDIRSRIEGADLAVCHLETPVSDGQDDLSYYPTFNVPAAIVDALAEVGYDTCSTASNHSWDRGAEGIAATLAQMDRVGLGHPGMAATVEEAGALTILDAGGVAVAHLSYTYGINGDLDTGGLVNLIDTDQIIADAAAHRAAGAEFVIVSLQWGDQYVTEPSSSQREQAPALLASPDIDLILGSHVHVLQPIERVGNEFVLFGLGNFLSNQSAETCGPDCPASTQDGALIEFTVTEQANGAFEVESLTTTPTYVDRTGGYRILPVREALATIGLAPSLVAPLGASLERSEAVIGTGTVD